MIQLPCTPPPPLSHPNQMLGPAMYEIKTSDCNIMGLHTNVFLAHLHFQLKFLHEASSVITLRNNHVTVWGYAAVKKHAYMNGVLSIPLAFHASNQLDQSSYSLPTLHLLAQLSNSSPQSTIRATVMVNLYFFFSSNDSQQQCSLLSHNLLSDQDGQKLHLTALCTFSRYSVRTKSGAFFFFFLAPPPPPPPPPRIIAKTWIFADHSPKYCCQAVSARVGEGINWPIFILTFPYL